MANYVSDFAGQHWASYHKLNRNSKHLAHKIDVVLFKPDGRGTLEEMRLERKTAEFFGRFSSDVLPEWKKFSNFLFCCNVARSPRRVR